MPDERHDIQRLTVITADDAPQTRWNEFLRLVRTGHDIDEAGRALGIRDGKFPTRVSPQRKDPPMTTITTITTSVRNESGSWEIIGREAGASLDGAEVSAHDIGGEVGQPLLIELRDEG